MVWADPGVAIPAAGWKIHLSARPENAAETVAVATGLCWRAGVTVKFLRSVRLVRLTQGKYAPRSSAGKVLTAYPPDTPALESLVEDLVRALRGRAGARIWGDVPVPGGAPVFVRYGAFLPTWTRDGAGRMVPGVLGPSGVRPDRRGGPTTTTEPPTSEPPTTPPAVQRWRAAAEAEDARDTLPIREARLAHRSNAGGVYQGRWPDGRLVAVKEARHHTGFDAGGADAATRLRHEHAVLIRLAGSGVAPEPVDLITTGSSDMLVTRWQQGRVASAVLAGEHPGVVPGGGDAASYRAWVDRLIEQTRRALATAERRGVSHGDVHPGNIIDAEGSVVLVDWESAALDGRRVASGVHALAEPGPDADGDGRPRWEDALLSPTALLIDRRGGEPELDDDLLRCAHADLAAGGRLTVGTGPRELTPGGLIAGLRLSASVDRDDRLFPGDPRQWRNPGGVVGLLHGAAGVLLALHETGSPPEPRWLDRFEASVGDLCRQPTAVRGLADGLDGIALAATRMGRDDLLADLLPILLDEPGTTAPWWDSGRAGAAVAAAEILAADSGRIRSEGELLARLSDHLDIIERWLETDREPAGYRPGLLTGWSGVALALLRVAQCCPALASRCARATTAALAREHRRARAVGTGMFLGDSGRCLPYLGHGVAGYGLAVHSVTERRWPLPPGVDGDDVIAAVTETLRCPVVMQAGLLAGRAGILLSLRRLSGEGTDVREHRRRLVWHSRPATPPSAGPARWVLGEQNLRCSADLGTGAAGVLAALSDDEPLTRLLALPQPSSPIADT